ncbi:MAG TPA: GvpL/GvpF family gas vesicle protein [Yinghuangia sp.]|uniref:GvpL/GvpF family gas vesicle protein n=1 Tax=Yinghuangia sp. YIM S10712 TaxID=3436930 RepID=UPI002C47197E|nr:GvpL/GvpF family gas vesicle protein [Yinghuangia sp.]
MATYVYAVVTADHPLPTSALGVGAPAEGPRKVAGPEGLAAVVGPAPEDLRARRRDVAAHHELLRELADHGPALPLQFGVVVPDDSAVEKHLAEHASLYADALARTAGNTEINVKAALDLDAVLADIVAADPNLLAQRERTRTLGGYDEQVRLGEMVAHAVSRYEAEISARIAEVLRPYAVDVSEGPKVQDHAANLSFLVPRGGVEAFQAAVDGLQGDIGPGIELRSTGPLPTYSFVPEPVGG